MTHQEPEYYHTVSELLSNIMDTAGYSRDDRDRKVTIATEFEAFDNMAAVFRKQPRGKSYMFGSRGEGSTGPGLQSDRDVLLANDCLELVTNLTDCQPNKLNYLMVKDEFTHPGYVKLQEIYISQTYIPVPMYHVEGSTATLSIDTLNRIVLPNTMHHGFGPVSGPAFHMFDVTRHNNKSDIVLAVRCSKWPQEGYEWFQRRRFYGWPTPKQIEIAWGYGCFATPVGHPHSHEEHVEWRLSFSIAERDLLRSFEDTAMKVYILLKMIKKTYIEPALGDAFSSYHCKVCLLWMNERTPRDLWNKENLLYCLILCIRQLYEWSTTGFCPDYFIVTNNIYDRKIFGKTQFDLVQILRYLLSTECRFLLEIECCCLGHNLSNAMSGFAAYHILSILAIVQEVHFNQEFSIANALYARLSILLYIPQYYPTLVDYLEVLVYASKHLPYNMQYPLKYVMMCMLCQLGFRIASICRKNTCFISREQVEYLMALASGCLSIGINSDATSVRLKLCGLGMELRYYDLTEACLQQISDYRMRNVYSISVDPMNAIVVFHCNLMSWVENILKNRYNTDEMMPTLVSFTVVYMQSEISITPTPLRMEMFRSTAAPPELRIELFHFWYNWGVVDSLMCLHFFQYLNFSRQGKERHKQTAMGNMIHVIRTEPRLLHRDTALNLLGFSFIQEKQLTNAFICFTESLKLRPYHNAAKFYLGLLFKRVHVKHRRQKPYENRRAKITS